MLELSHVDADSGYHNWLEAKNLPHTPERELAFKEAWRILSDFIAGPEQKAVDWSVVCEAVHDASDIDGIGAKALESAFASCGLLVVHKAAKDQSSDDVVVEKYYNILDNVFSQIALASMRIVIAIAQYNERNRCANIADAKYTECARLAAYHQSQHQEESMDRCYSAARSAQNIASLIRNPLGRGHFSDKRIEEIRAGNPAMTPDERDWLLTNPQSFEACPHSFHDLAQMSDIGLMEVNLDICSKFIRNAKSDVT